MPLAAAISLGLGWLSAPARACSYVPVDARLVAEDVPLSGPIVIDVQCTKDSYCEAGNPSIRVTYAGAELAGTTEILRGPDHLYAVFRPAAELVGGSLYDVELLEMPEGAFRRTVHARTFTAAVPNPANIPVTLGTVPFPTGQEYCCGGGFACFQTCVTAEARIEATLTPAWPERAVALYRLRYAEKDGSARETPWGTRPFARFAQPADRYCATLEVKNLVDGKVSKHQVCQPGSDALQVGAQVPAELGPDLFTFDCFSPPSAPGIETPAMLVEAWCGNWRAACSQDRALCASLDVAERCGFELPAAGPSEDAARQAHAGDARRDSPPGLRPPRQEGLSCATQPTVARSRTGLWCGALFALLGLGRVFRKRRWRPATQRTTSCGARPALSGTATAS